MKVVSLMIVLICSPVMATSPSMESFIQSSTIDPTEVSHLAQSTSSDAVLLIDGESRIQMRKRSPIIRTGYAPGVLIVDGALAQFRGSNAELRTSNTPEFQVTLPSDVFPEDYIFLVKLKERSDRRYVTISRQSFITGDVQVGFRNQDMIDIVISEVSQNEGGSILYRVSVEDSLDGGEYALVLLSIDSTASEVYEDSSYYDFGVD